MREVKKRVEQKTKTVGGEGQRAWKEGVGGRIPRWGGSTTSRLTALNDHRVGFIRIMIQCSISSCIVLLCFFFEGSRQVFHLLNVIHPGKPLKNGGWRLLFPHAGDADPGSVQ